MEANMLVFIIIIQCHLVKLSYPLHLYRKGEALKKKSLTKRPCIIIIN